MAHAIAWVALLVLSLGLPRLFVICVGPRGDPHLEFVHAAGGCCAHDDGRERPAGGGDDEAGRDHGGCVDLALAVETAPLPEAPGVDLEQQPRAMGRSIGVPDDQSWTTAVLRPPTTGPPRVDRRTALVAVTVLRH